MTVLNEEDSWISQDTATKRIIQNSISSTVESRNIARPLTLRIAPVNEHYTTTDFWDNFTPKHMQKVVLER